MMKGVRIVSSLAVAALSFSLMACSGGNEDLVSEDGTSGSGKTKLVFLRAGTEDYKKAVFNQMIDDFEKEYPEYEVEYQEAP